MKTIQTLTTADLRKIERDIESGAIAPTHQLAEPFKSIMLRGIQTEIESRSTLHRSLSTGQFDVRTYH